MSTAHQFGNAAARLFLRAACGVSLSLCFVSGLAHAQNPLPRESRDKAHFLANVPSFVDWPENALNSPQAPVTICVLGESRLVFVLAEATRGMTLHSRRVEIRWAAKDEELRGCHVVFISRSQARRYSQVMNRLNREGVLTVGESSEFLAAGGVIALDYQNETLQFEVNLQAAESARLKISSRLLALARRVIPKNEGARS